MGHPQEGLDHLKMLRRQSAVSQMFPSMEKSVMDVRVEAAREAAKE